MRSSAICGMSGESSRFATNLAFGCEADPGSLYPQPGHWPVAASTALWQELQIVITALFLTAALAWPLVFSFS
jgi:hypothetical protein